MDRNEPSLVPEWLRTNGGGSSSNHFASSQADGSVLAFPGRSSRSSKSFGNSDSLHSPRLDHQSSSSDSRRSSNGNGFSKHDKSSYALSYSSFSRNNRDRDRERSTTTDSWDSKYSDPLKGMINGRVDDPLRRSKSLISRNQGDAPQRMRNDGQKNHYNGNGSNPVGCGVTSIQKVSFERDFPVLGSDERPPDVIRVSSPGLSSSIQSLSICNPPSVGSETWTSALVEVSALQPAPTVSTLSSSSVPVTAITSSGLNMAEALVQAPAQPLNTPQLQKDELALAQSKKLIPMTPLLPKTMVPSSSDKLKPKTALRSTETAITQKNGIHHLPPLQLSSQPIRGANVRGDGPKSPSSNKLLLLKPGRENGVSPSLKDLQSPKANFINRVGNGHPAGNSSVAAGLSKNSLNPKFLPGERRTSGNGSTPVTGVDKRTSRSNFFKLMREKSLNNTSGTIDSGGSSISSTAIENLDKETQRLAGAHVTSAEARSELKCNGETCTVSDSLSPSMAIDNEEERKFLLSLGWEDHDESDEEGLTEEEIFAFYRDEVMKQGPTSRLCRVLQAKVFSHVISSSSTEANTPASQTEA